MSNLYIDGGGQFKNKNILSNTSISKDARWIKELWKSNKKGLIQMFKMLVYYGIDYKFIIHTVKKGIAQNKTDVNIIKLFAIKRHAKDTRRCEQRAKDIKHLLSLVKFKIKRNYLDIGCGDGKITVGISKHIKVQGETHGTDIIKWTDRKQYARSLELKFTPINYNKKNPLCYENDMFGIITVLQTLHHVERLDIFISEIARIIKTDGILIIREHNVTNKLMGKLIDVHHVLYDIINNESDGKFHELYYSSYKNAEGWDEILRKHGFQLVMHKFNKFNTFGIYYAVYKYNFIHL